MPAGEPLLEPHLRDDVTTVTFGPEGDVDELGDVELPFDSAHMRRNAMAAIAAARAVGVEPHGPVDVALSELRGQRIELPDGVVVVNDCYNANPMSMRAALDDLAATARGRRVAVLGDMLELGPDERRFHAEVGADARAAGVDVLVTVGPLAPAHGVGLRRRGPAPRRDGRRGGGAAARAARAGGHGARQGLARRGPRGRGRGAAGRSLMGRVLIAGTAALLICIFL